MHGGGTRSFSKSPEQVKGCSVALSKRPVHSACCTASVLAAVRCRPSLRNLPASNPTDVFQDLWCKCDVSSKCKRGRGKDGMCSRLVIARARVRCKEAGNKKTVTRGHGARPSVEQPAPSRPADLAGMFQDLRLNPVTRERLVQSGGELGRCREKRILQESVASEFAPPSNWWSFFVFYGSWSQFAVAVEPPCGLNFNEANTCERVWRGFPSAHAKHTQFHL